MPLFEYQCNHCNKITELLVRSGREKPVCECGSGDLHRVLSSFAVSHSNGAKSSGCADGSCNIPTSPCASGLCGL